MTKPDPHRIDAVLACALEALDDALHALYPHEDQALADALEFAINRRAVLDLLPLTGDDARAGQTIAHVIRTPTTPMAERLRQGDDGHAHVILVAARRLAATAVSLAGAQAVAPESARILWQAAESLTGLGVLGKAADDVADTPKQPARTPLVEAWEDVEAVLRGYADFLRDDREYAAAASKMRDAIAAAMPSAEGRTPNVDAQVPMPLSVIDGAAGDGPDGIVAFFASAGVPCEVVVEDGGQTLRPRIGKPSAEQRRMLEQRGRHGPLSVLPTARALALTEGGRSMVIRYPDGRHFALRYTVVGEDD